MSNSVCGREVTEYKISEISKVSLNVKLGVHTNLMSVYPQISPFI